MSGQQPFREMLRLLPMSYKTFDYHAMILHPQEDRVLMLGGPAGWKLPHFVPDKHNYSVVDHVNEAVRTSLGPTVTTLRCIDYSLQPKARRVRATYALEMHSSRWTPPAHARWIGAEEIDDLELSSPYYDRVLRRWFEGAVGASEPRVPWARRGWFENAAAWIREQAATAGRPLTGPVQQLKSSGGSCVLRAEAGPRDLYFKAVPGSTDHEPAMTRDLSELYPGKVPRVLRISRERSWLLMDEVVGRPLYLEPRIDQWLGAVREFAELQLDAAAHVDRWLELGCPDRRLERFAEEIPGFLERVGETGLLRLKLVSESELARLRDRSGALQSLCAELGRLDLPHTVVHGDFHAHNLTVTEEGYTFIDWGDAFISHPFLSLGILLEYANQLLPEVRSHLGSVRDSYLEVWTGLHPLEELISAFERSRPLAALHHAMILERGITGREEHAHWEKIEGQIALAACLKSLPILDERHAKRTDEVVATREAGARRGHRA